jgi:hypothetical protein
LYALDILDMELRAGMGEATREEACESRPRRLVGPSREVGR